MGKFDFSNPPSDVALLLSQPDHTDRPAVDLARVMSLDEADKQVIHDGIGVQSRDRR
jgi:hypothetical protein